MILLVKQEMLSEQIHGTVAGRAAFLQCTDSATTRSSDVQA